MSSNNQTTFDYDTGFLCTYHLMNDNESDHEDIDMSENLYRIQLSQALRMNMDISRIIAGDSDGYDHHTMEQFIDFISDKTKPYYDERYKAVLRKHPCLTFKCDEQSYDTEVVNDNDGENVKKREDEHGDEHGDEEDHEEEENG